MNDRLERSNRRNRWEYMDNGLGCQNFGYCGSKRSLQHPQNLCPPFELPLDKVRHCDDGAGCVGGGTAVTPATRAFRAEPDTG